MVSVIIPAYNAAGYIRQAIESVLSQTYKNIEIIVVNDGSVDETGLICKELAMQNSCVRYYEKENTGVSDTRNIAFRYAKGEFITFLDSDDYLPPYAVETMIRKLKTNDCDAVFGNHAYEYDGKILPRVPRVKEGCYTYEQLRERLLDDGTLTGMLFGSVCGCYYKKEIIQKNNLSFDSRIKVNEDGFFNLLYLKKCTSICIIDEPYVYVYRQWKNYSKKPLSYDERFIVATNIINAYLGQQEDAEQYQKQIACREVSIAFWNALRVKDYKTDIKSAYKYLDTLFGRDTVQNGLQYMDYVNMNKYKRMMCFIMKHQMKVTFYLLIRYIYPVMEKVLKR